ncbi:MAG: 30S ribosomal protein S13 [Alphaproteobacteria bacterium]|nr:30S ribosomal protein S13 [Alphaproteobacteria bacterium]
MVRFLGVDLPQNKKINYALTSIYGIGLSRATEILQKIDIDFKQHKKGFKIEDLSDSDIIKLRKILEKDYQLEGDLKRIIKANINRLIKIGSVRGRRHRILLPVRGQRTRTNARTRRNMRKRLLVRKK